MLLLVLERLVERLSTVRRRVEGLLLAIQLLMLAVHLCLIAIRSLLLLLLLRPEHARHPGKVLLSLLGLSVLLLSARDDRP